VYHFRNVVNNPIILTDDDDNNDDYKNLDNAMNVFRENGNNLKPDTDDGTRLVKHFVPSTDRYGYVYDNINCIVTSYYLWYFKNKYSGKILLLCIHI